MKVSLLRKWIDEHQPHGETKLAAAAEISPVWLSRLLNQGRTPGLDIAKRLATVVGVSLDELCREDEESPGPEAA